MSISAHSGLCKVLVLVNMVLTTTVLASNIRTQTEGSEEQPSY